MEDALARAIEILKKVISLIVLILVLMEDALAPTTLLTATNMIIKVLILVLMEDALALVIVERINATTAQS